MNNQKKYFTCPMRSLEGERLDKYLQSHKEEYTLIGSCAVTKLSEKKVIEAIKQQEGRIVLFGCVSKQIQVEIDKKENIKVFKTVDLNNLFEKGSVQYEGIETTSLQYTIETDSLCNRQYEDIAEKNKSVLQKIFHKSKPIPFLVVAQGCNNQCSYCHTKFYVGKVKNKPIEKIKSEYSELIKKGDTFINIIAEDIGSYGIDINSDLPQLLNEMDSITENSKIHWMLDGLQPKWYLLQKHSLIPLIKKKRISAISVPVQSGSDRIIKLMNREYGNKDSIECLNEFRKLNPKLYLQGIFIVGFPSESENDFNETLNFIRAVKFNDVTLIPYSEFSICESSKIEQKISDEIIHRRIDFAMAELKSLGIKTRM